MPSVTASVSYLYAALLFVGALIGFLKAGSVDSIVTAGSAALAIAALEYFGSDGYTIGATLVQIGVASYVAFVMYARFQVGRKFMPAGLTLILSAVVILLYCARLVRGGGYAAPPRAKSA